MEVDSTVAEETDNQSEFPVTELAKLDEMINRPRWVVPVLPNGELELLLEAAINLCKKGIDTQSEHCQNFFKDGLTISFTKILTDEAVSGWKYEIHVRNSAMIVGVLWNVWIEMYIQKCRTASEALRAEAAPWLVSTARTAGHGA